MTIEDDETLQLQPLPIRREHHRERSTASRGHARRQLHTFACYVLVDMEKMRRGDVYSTGVDEDAVEYGELAGLGSVTETGRASFRNG